MSPYISIIIPIYNVAPYIENCLMSVINQSYKNIEIVLVDDCGTDDSMMIVSSFISSHSANWVLMVHETNKGLSAARNTGVKNATGEYLYFLDSDDELPQNAMMIFVEFLQEYGDADFLIGNYIVDGNFRFTPLFTPVLLNSRKEIFNAYIQSQWYVMACGKLIKRTFFIKNNLWFIVGRLHEDELFSFRLALTASKMITVEGEVYKYIIRDNSITIAKKEKNYIDMYWILVSKIKLIQKNSILFDTVSPSAYTVSMLFQFTVFVSVSQLSHLKKRIFLMWVNRQLQLIDKHDSLKSTIEVLIISFSPTVTIWLCKLVNSIYKSRIVRVQTLNIL